MLPLQARSSDYTVRIYRLGCLLPLSSGWRTAEIRCALRRLPLQRPIASRATLQEGKDKLVTTSHTFYPESYQ